MRELHGVVGGPLVVVEPVLLHGVVDGDVTVEAGGDLVIRGAVLGDLTVRRGRASVHGTVTGHVRNEAGELLVTGAVHRGISSSGEAEPRTSVVPGACVWVAATLRGAVFAGEQRRPAPVSGMPPPRVSLTGSGSAR